MIFSKEHVPLMVLLEEVCSPILNSKNKEIHFSLNNAFGKDIGDFKKLESTDF